MYEIYAYPYGNPSAKLLLTPRPATNMDTSIGVYTLRAERGADTAPSGGEAVKNGHFRSSGFYSKLSKRWVVNRHLSARECADLCGIKKRTSMCAFGALKKTRCIVRSHGHARPRIVFINSYFEQKCTRKKEGYSNGTETGQE